MTTTTTEPPRQPDPRDRHEIYTPGHSPTTTAFMAARTLESHAAFVLPLLEPGMEVLDAGCGPGSITQGLAELALPGRVTGIDRDAPQVARAARLAEGRELINARFTAASVYQLPFVSDSFDLVFSHALFEHLADPATALTELRRVLRPGGLIALCCPDWDAFELLNPTPEAAAALATYRDLQEQNGGNTRAGARLVSWLETAEFRPLTHGQRFETNDPFDRTAEYLALQLETGGHAKAARTLLDWSLKPGAGLLTCWKHATAIKWNP